MKMADDIKLYEFGSSETVENVKKNSYVTEFNIDQINFDAEKDNFIRVSTLL